MPLRGRTVLCVLALPVRLAAAGVVEGLVALPAADAPVPKPRYPLAASYEVGAPDPPAAVVWIDAPGAVPPADDVEMAQHRYQFVPGLLPVVRGTRVAFPNRDDEYHSVFSYSRAKRFDLGRYQRDETPATIVFDQPGVVRLFCEIHDHMRGTILVLDTPLFTKTDAAGRYRLGGVPPGRHAVYAWVAEHDVRTATVEVTDGAPARADFPAP